MDKVLYRLYHFAKNDTYDWETFFLKKMEVVCTYRARDIMGTIHYFGSKSYTLPCAPIIEENEIIIDGPTRKMLACGYESYFKEYNAVVYEPRARITDHIEGCKHGKLFVNFWIGNSPPKASIERIGCTTDMDDTNDTYWKLYQGAQCVGSEVHLTLILNEIRKIRRLRQGHFLKCEMIVENESDAPIVRVSFKDITSIKTLPSFDQYQYLLEFVTVNVGYYFTISKVRYEDHDGSPIESSELIPIC